MQRFYSLGQRTFASLSIRNYRLYFIGQAISLSGTWMQTIAQGLLVLQITHSGTALGIVTALQFLPILFLAPLGGVIADKYSKQHILYVTQTLAGILALLLGIIVLTHVVQLWMIYLLAIGLGFVNSADNPTRQTFLGEMVGGENLTNAVSLNSSEVNLARVIGPLIAGVLILTVGIGLCFILNGLSYGAVLFVLARMNPKEFHLDGKKAASKRGQLKEGLVYILKTPVLRNVLLMLLFIGTLTYEFSVILPLFSQFTFHGNAATYALLMAALGLGSVIGGLYTASKKHLTEEKVVVAALLFGLAMLVAAVMPIFPLAMIAMVAVGIFSINFLSTANSVLQLTSLPEMRGRVMSFWTLAMLGSTPIGGPIVGWIGEHVSPRWGIAIGGIAALVAAGIGFLLLSRREVVVVDETIEPLNPEIESEKSSRIL